MNLPDEAGEVLSGLLRLDPAARLPASTVLRFDWLGPDNLPDRQVSLRPYMRLAEERYAGLAGPVKN